VTLDGIVTLDELLATPSETVVAAAAAVDRVTVQVAVAGGTIVTGLHASLLS
jgi:hypothetical protein